MTRTRLLEDPEAKVAVYVITCKGRDNYSAMTRVSVASLRATNPGIKIAIICDEGSATAMRACDDPLLDEVDALSEFEAPEANAVYINRYLKSKLRNLVEGQYLFLDSDMLIRGDLRPLFAYTTDIAGAPNRSKADPTQQYLQGEKDIITTMGWTVRNDLYLNGGLMLANDTPRARAFADAWHSYWLRSVSKTRSYRDQPALNAAIHDTGVGLGAVPREYNTQFSREPSLVPEARIWHYYASLKRTPITEFELMTDAIASGGELERRQFEKVIGASHPWRRAFWGDDLVAKIVIRKNRFDTYDALWFEGRRFTSVRLRLRDQAKALAKKVLSPFGLYPIRKKSPAV